MQTLHTMVQPIKDMNTRKKFENMKIYTFNNEKIFLCANAGSGKTTSSVNFVENHPESEIFILSYAKVNIADITKKLKERGCLSNNVELGTFDSLCYRNRRKLHNPPPAKNGYHSNIPCTNAIDKCFYREEKKVTYNDIIEDENKLNTFAKYVIEKNLPHNMYIDRIVILYKFEYKKIDVFIIDEAQDLSLLQRLFFDKHIEGNKVKIFVGDDKQTIYHETSVLDDIGDNVIYRYTHTFRFGSPLIGIINRYGTLHTSSGTNQTRLMPVQTVDDIDAFFYVLISSWKDIIGFDLSNFELENNDIKKIQGKVAKHRAYLKMSEQYARVSNKDLTKEQFFTDRGALDLLDFHQEKWLFIEEKIKEMKSKKRKRGAKKNIIKTIHGSKGKEYNNVFIDPSCLPEYNNHPASWKKKDKMYYTAITRAKKRLYFMGKFYEPFYTTHLIEKCRENPMFVLPKSYEKYRESFLNEARRQQK